MLLMHLLCGASDLSVCPHLPKFVEEARPCHITVTTGSSIAHIIYFSLFSLSLFLYYLQQSSRQSLVHSCDQREQNVNTKTHVYMHIYIYIHVYIPQTKTARQARGSYLFSVVIPLNIRIARCLSLGT